MQPRRVDLLRSSSMPADTGVVAVAIGGYYALVWALEVRWPVFGILLGRRAQASYDDTSR